MPQAKTHFNRSGTYNYYRVQIRMRPELHDQIRQEAYSPERFESIGSWVEEACREKLERDKGLIIEPRYITMRITKG